MRLIDFANTQRLAVGVRLPTDCGLVLPRWALGPQIMAWCGVEERLACHLYPVCASELLSNQGPKHLSHMRSGISPLYFPP